jgi:hypothetical protein
MEPASSKEYVFFRKKNGIAALCALKVCGVQVKRAE